MELTWEQLAAVSVFLLALGALLRFADLRYPGTMNANDTSNGPTHDKVAAQRTEGVSTSDRIPPY